MNGPKIGLTPRILAILVIIAIFILAAYLFFINQPVTVVAEVPIDMDGEIPLTYTRFERYEPAIGYLIAAIILFMGLLIKRVKFLAWIGFILLVAWSFLFLFSSGAAFLLLAGLLFILMVLDLRYTKVNPSF